MHKKSNNERVEHGIGYSYLWLQRLRGLSKKPRDTFLVRFMEEKTASVSSRTGGKQGPRSATPAAHTAMVFQR